MKTKIFTSVDIKKAGKIIKEGNLVAFPTETVYGLGANALDKDAVKKIFIAKGRPTDNPLIVHIGNKDELSDIAKIEESKKKLINKIIKKFWPGPLTIILDKKDKVPHETTCGLETVAVRMPKNKIALKLIKYSGCPIAAPSANISGKPSGTCFDHVFDDFNGKISCIIKSKSCEIGLESTVVDMTTNSPVLLRPGGVSYEELKKFLPNIKICSNKKTKIVKSPGMKYKHYSPDAKIIYFKKTADNQIPIYLEKYKKENKRVKVLFSNRIKDLPRKLFKIFRQCDKDKIDYILVSSIKENGIGSALINRIQKAAFEIIEK